MNIKGSAGSLVTFVSWTSSWIVSYSFNFLFDWSRAGHSLSLFWKNTLYVDCTYRRVHISKSEDLVTSLFNPNPMLATYQKNINKNCQVIESKLELVVGMTKSQFSG